MKTGFYPKLAWSGIHKNRQLYFPYILTCICMVAMYYIVSFLSMSETVQKLPGGENIMTMLGLGGWIILIFALIFLFYTNSFISRRRTKEFGLYNILGMGKRNIAIILFWENLTVCAVSLVGGGMIGVIMSKLAELGFVNAMKGSVDYDLSISWEALLNSVGFFAIIFFLIFIKSVLRVSISNPVELLRSENAGEKPPKANFVLGILSVIILASAYYIAVSIEDPVSALGWFFIAVIMVILGTYLLFISGSVMFCRVLQRNKNYYYKPNHFVSVSSMVYRMKRNGAGLASICVLATMVLVILSSTTCLFFGAEDALRARFPREINVIAYFDEMNDENVKKARAETVKTFNEYGIEPKNVMDVRFASLMGMINGDRITAIGEANSLTGIYQVYIIPIEDYNSFMNQNEVLSKDEVLVYTDGFDYNKATLQIEKGSTFKVKKHLESFMQSAINDVLSDVTPSLFIVVPDLNSALKGLEGMTNFNGDRIFSLSWKYSADTGLNAEKQSRLNESLTENIRSVKKDETNKIKLFYCNSREENRGDYYGNFGGMFFLGIILSIIFIFAAVLIIYYKQITEGFEDQARFEIMQKVGMTKKEIRRSINSQLLTVFFMPLVFSALHLAFAFPMIRKLLLLFALNNVKLFALTTIISFLIFALFYTIVYRITSNAYYNIVSGAKKD